MYCEQFGKLNCDLVNSVVINGRRLTALYLDIYLICVSIGIRLIIKCLLIAEIKYIRKHSIAAKKYTNDSGLSATIFQSNEKNVKNLFDYITIILLKSKLNLSIFWSLLLRLNESSLRQMSVVRLFLTKRPNLSIKPFDVKFDLSRHWGGEKNVPYNMPNHMCWRMIFIWDCKWKSTHPISMYAFT